jgi:hypothetical protein
MGGADEGISVDGTEAAAEGGHEFEPFESKTGMEAAARASGCTFMSALGRSMDLSRVNAWRPDPNGMGCRLAAGGAWCAGILV